MGWPAGSSRAALGAGEPANRLQNAVDDLHAIGVTGVPGLTGAGGRTTTARSGVADLDTGVPGDNPAVRNPHWSTRRSAPDRGRRVAGW